MRKRLIPSYDEDHDGEWQRRYRKRAQQLFAGNGITVVVGVPAETPEQLASAYLSGTLQAGEKICDH